MIYKQAISVLCLVIMTLHLPSCSSTLKPEQQIENPQMLSYVVNLKQQHLEFYWKNDSGQIYGSIKQLREELNQTHKKLIFAMNGGMYTKSQKPLGLYIENGQTKTKLNQVKNAYGNFYLQPNGIFYLTNNKMAHIITTSDYRKRSNIEYATQSGPMLIIDGNIHPKLKKGSSNLHIRNGVGILPNGNVLFAMSKSKINFYDFASFFKNKGCQNALYLDGFVCKTYLPKKQWSQLGGNFGVIIAETKRK